MDKQVVKLIVQAAISGLVAWAVASAMAKKQKHQRDPTQFPQASRVWFPSLVDKPNAEPYSVQPQTALY
jgi:hypothetical protein